MNPLMAVDELLTLFPVCLQYVIVVLVLWTSLHSRCALFKAFHLFKHFSVVRWP